MARFSAAFVALAMLPGAAAAAPDAAAQREAAKVAAALAELTRFTVDVAGNLPAGGGMLGAIGGQSSQRLEARFDVDASGKSARWRAQASVVLPTGGANINTVAVQQGGELFISANLPIPGAGNKIMAYRMPAPQAPGGMAPAQLGASSAGQFTSWLEGQLEKVGPEKVSHSGRTLHLKIQSPSLGGEEDLALTYDARYLPTRVVLGNPRAPRADVRFTNFRTDGPVDTSLPLPADQYQAMSPAMLAGLSGMMGGGGAPVASSSRTPARSPFVKQPATTTLGSGAGLPAIPIPGLGGAAPNQQQSVALQGIVSTLTKQLGQAMAPPPPGKQESGIPGLKLSPGTMNLLKHMQKLREGQGSGSGGNPAQGLQALTGMLERLGSGARPGASMQPESLDKASDTIQQLLQRLRAGRAGVPGATSAPAATSKALKNPPRRGMSGGRATSTEALKRMQELMKKLKRTAPVSGK